MTHVNRVNERNSKRTEEKVNIIEQKYEEICVLHKVKSKFRSTTQAMETFKLALPIKDYEVKKIIGYKNLQLNRKLRIYTRS